MARGEGRRRDNEQERKALARATGLPKGSCPGCGREWYGFDLITCGKAQCRTDLAASSTEATQPFGFRPTRLFFALADPLIQSERSLCGYELLYVLWQAIRNTVSVQGSVAEVGTFRGGSAFFIASAFRELSGAEVPFSVFDTFEGHPQQAISEHDTVHTAGTFRGTSYEDVRSYLSGFSRLEVHKGDILNALPQLPDAQYRLVHIDTDLYLPTLACLEHFGTRMSRSGVVIVDDYAAPKCTGVPKAVAEYMGSARCFDVWDMRTAQLVLVKR